jgi:hypothetical protein
MIVCMRRLALLLLLPVLLPAQAAGPAQPGRGDIEAYAKLPVCKLTPDGRRLAVEPCRTAPPKRPMPRRPVPLAVEPMPRMAEPAALPPPAASGPVLPLVLEPRQPAPSISNIPAPGAFAAPPPGPGPLTPATCGAGGCRDSNGTFYGGPPGSVSVAPNGRQCVTSSAGFVQCF